MPVPGFIANVDMNKECLEANPSRPKPPCNCGCKDDKSKSFIDSTIPASAEFQARVEKGVQSLLEKAKTVRLSGRKW
jgi:hypothetical protein